MPILKKIATEYEKTKTKTKSKPFHINLMDYYKIIQTPAEHTKFIEAIYFLSRRGTSSNGTQDYIDYFIKLGNDFVPLELTYSSEDLVCKGVSLFNTSGPSWTTSGKGRSKNDTKFLEDCHKISEDRNSRVVIQDSLKNTFKVEIDNWKKVKFSPLESIDILRLDLLIAVYRTSSKKKKDIKINEYINGIGLNESILNPPETQRNIALLDNPEAKAILKKRENTKYSTKDDINLVAAFAAVFSTLAPDDMPENSTEYNSAQMYLHMKNFLKKKRTEGQEIMSNSCCTFTTVDSYRVKEENIVRKMNNARKNSDKRAKFLTSDLANNFIYYEPKAGTKEYYLSALPIYYFALYDKPVCLKLSHIDLNFSATCAKQGTCKASCTTGGLISVELLAEKRIKGILGDDSDDEAPYQPNKKQEDDETLGADDFGDEEEESNHDESLLGDE